MLRRPTRSASMAKNAAYDTAAERAKAVAAKVAAQAATIKNRGRLNKAFAYFAASDALTPVTGVDTELSDDAAAKFFTVAADMIVFNTSGTHVLMIFRCPHDKRNGRTCSSNVLDTSSFQYKGCLATPGGFFDVRADMADGIPDYMKSAVRELNEECNKLLQDTPDITASQSKIVFVGPEFNNYRDIRWYTSTNYVPTLATQFATVLQPTSSQRAQKPLFHFGPDHSDLPKVKGTDDACGNAYWVDLKIIDKVYADFKETYDSFDKPYSDQSFYAFVNSHFVLDKDTKMPTNKLKSENGLVKNLGPKDYVVKFDKNATYDFTDFAFDHVRNIVNAKQFLKI